MYELNYNYSFLLSFITTFIFLSLLLIFCFSQFFANDKSISIFGNFQPIIIFFIIFSIIVFIFNILIYLDFFNNLNYAFFALIFLFFFIWLIFGSKIKINTFNIKKYLDKKNIIIIIFFITFFFISILPISDADSVAIHQNLANFIYLNGLDSINLQKDFEFTTLANSEILLILSPILKSDNFGSQLNFFSLLLLFIVSYKKNKSFIFFIFSCPLLIFLISTQKLQLFFGVLYLVLFIIVHQKLLKKKIEIFLFIFLLAFYASAKISYIIIALPLFFYFLILNKKNIKLIIYYSFIVFFIFFAPIFLIKFKFFGNPITPFYNSFFNLNNEFINLFALNLRSSEGWLGNTSDWRIFLKPFIPISVGQLSNTLGVLFLIQIFNLSLLKETKFIPVIIIVLILCTGQILPRYYFEAFLILSFFYKPRNISLINFIKIFQGLAILTLSFGFIFIAYFKHNVFFDKRNFMNQFTHSFFDNTQIENLGINENILAFTQERQSIFFEKNIYGSRGIYIKLLNSNLQDATISFIKENAIKYIIVSDSHKIHSCVVLNKIDDINQKASIRNFFLNEAEKKYGVYLINIKGCNL